MQTFLPYPDLRKSARALDDKRLRNQVNEALIILRTLTGYYAEHGKKGWPHHPATKMWKGYEKFLAMYIVACQDECYYRNLKFNDIDVSDLVGAKSRLWLRYANMADGNWSVVKPVWFGNVDFHFSHRCNLWRKAQENLKTTGTYEIYDWYREKFSNETIKLCLNSEMPYIWPKGETS